MIKQGNWWQDSQHNSRDFVLSSFRAQIYTCKRESSPPVSLSATAKLPDRLTHNSSGRRDSDLSKLKSTRNEAPRPKNVFIARAILREGGCVFLVCLCINSDASDVKNPCYENGDGISRL
jgi:sirohydrochlorin ferrochelatase